MKTSHHTLLFFVAIYFSATGVYASPRITGGLDEGEDAIHSNEQANAKTAFEKQKSELKTTRLSRFVTPQKKQMINFTEVEFSKDSEHAEKKHEQKADFSLDSKDYSEEDVLSFIKDAEKATKPSTFLLVTTKTYGGRVTRVQISNPTTSSHASENALVAWSNVDWAYLSGFTGFETEEEAFTFLHLHHEGTLAEWRKIRANGSVSLRNQLKQLPSLQKSGSHCVLEVDSWTPLDELGELTRSNDSETSPAVFEASALAFLEGIHELYDLESSRLIQARYGREKKLKRLEAKKAQAVKKGSVPKEIEVLFYNPQSNFKSSSHPNFQLNSK